MKPDPISPADAQAIVSELARVRVIFQVRALSAAMGLPLQPQEPPK